jgi:hypothetical protein
MKRWWMLFLVLALLAAPIHAQRDPDTDGDGIPDSVDLCPRQPGPRDNRGCPVPTPTPNPDRDGDGLPDNVDQCPSDPGPRDNRGCPLPVPVPSDRDGDTVTDDIDRCPDQPGPRDNFGCPVQQQRVEPTSPPALPTRPPYRPAPPPDTQRCYATPATETNVNVREQPTTQGRILRTLPPNTHLLVLEATLNPQGQTWFKVELPDGTAFVADSAVVTQGNCANLGIPAPAPVPQGGSMPAALCFIDPFKVAGSFAAGSVDDVTTVPNPELANPETGAMFLNAAVVTVSQPVRATFSAAGLPLNVPWANSVPAATFLRVTISNSSFQQVAYQEVPIGQTVSVDLQPGDYYWLFQLDTAGASLSVRCEPRVEEAPAPYMPICIVSTETDSNGDLINPRPMDKMPLVDGQDQPNSAGVYAMEYPFIAREDILLRVLVSGSSPVKTMLFLPSVQRYESETTIPANGFADIPVPQGVYTLEFFSTSPFGFFAICWPGDTPPEVLGTPEPVSEVGDAMGFIMGDCVAASGFEENGMPKDAFSFAPMTPLKLEYLTPNDNGKFFQDIKYLIVNVPSNLFFNVSSNQGTLDLYVYDIAKGGVKASATYLAPGNHSIYLPESVYYVSFTSSVAGYTVVNCLPASEFPSGSSSPFDLPIPEQPISELLGVPLYGFKGYAPTPGSAEGEAALTPDDSSLPPLLLKRTGDRSVQIELPTDGFFFANPDSPADDSPNGRPVLIRPSFVMGDGSVIPFDQPEDGSSTIPDPATSLVTGLRVDFSLPNGLGGFDDPIGGLVLEAQKGQKDCIPGDAKCIGQGGSGGGPQPFVFYLFNKGKSLTLSLSAAQAVLDALGTPTPSGSEASFFAPASGVFSPCLQTLTDSAGNFAGVAPFTEASFPLYYPTEDMNIFAHTITVGLSQVSTLTNTRISALVPDADPNYLRLYAWGSAEKIGDQVREISIEIPPGFYFFIVANVQLDPITLQLGLDTIPTDTLILRCEVAN